MNIDDCGCKKIANFHPGKKNDERKCDCCCTSGLKEKLHRCQWVLIFTKDDELPVFGHVRKVTCDVVTLDNVFVPFIPFVSEAVVSLCEITKFLKFSDPSFKPESVTDAMKRMVK